ncbi:MULTISPECIES: Yip1 family protein [Rhodopirellula]|uniref:Yip1 family protein n=1 Tax=Rhodopirellula TaxID=265488 RepID=UPI00257F99D3|nr:Yip1 family protein [Rhodopirellula sp. UBA1907]
MSHHENPYSTPQFTTSDPAGPPTQHEPPGEFKPFKTIWLSPRRTVRQIVSVDPTLHVVLLACLSGIGETLDRASMRDLGDRLPLPAIIAVAVILGPIGGLIGVWIGAWLVAITGKWMGGKGTSETVRTALTWASIPSIVASILWIPQLLLLREELFTSETPRLESNPGLIVPVLALSLVEIVLAIWSFVLMCNTIAEVQSFGSAWRGFFNLLLAGAVVFVPIMALVFAAVALG